MSNYIDRKANDIESMFNYMDRKANDIAAMFNYMDRKANDIAAMFNYMDRKANDIAAMFQLHRAKGNAIIAGYLHRDKTRRLQALDKAATYSSIFFRCSGVGSRHTFSLKMRCLYLATRS
jgi:hypothetical protein